jgi:hypothetical protein
MSALTDHKLRANLPDANQSLHSAHLREKEVNRLEQALSKVGEAIGVRVELGEPPRAEALAAYGERRAAVAGVRRLLREQPSCSEAMGKIVAHLAAYAELLSEVSKARTSKASRGRSASSKQAKELVKKHAFAHWAEKPFRKGKASPTALAIMGAVNKELGALGLRSLQEGTIYKHLLDLKLL